MWNTEYDTSEHMYETETKDKHTYGGQGGGCTGEVKLGVQLLAGAIYYTESG